MSIADKLTAIAENEQKVFEAGKDNFVDATGTLRGSASGTGGVFLSDISSVANELKVKVSSPTTVKQYGKNLAKVYGFSARSMANKALTNNYGTTISTTEAGNSVEVTQAQAPVADGSNHQNGYFCVGIYNIPDKTGITFSFDVDIKSNPLNVESFSIFCNNAAIGYARKTSGNKYSITFNWVVNGAAQEVEIRAGGVSGIFSNFQLELGAEATSYEPYIEPISADITTEATLTAISSNVTLLADDGAVTINCEYVKDVDKLIEAGKKSEHDAFWDSFQDKGKRGKYYYAFCGECWGTDFLKPKYDIRPTTAEGMFRDFTNNEKYNPVDLAKHFEDCGVALDFSRCTNLSVAFNYSCIGRLGVVDLKALTSSLNYSFANMGKLTTIDKFISYEHTNFAATTFSGDTNLESIIFEGVIAKNGLDLHWSTKLNKASITSIVNALSSTTTGLTVTFSLAAVNKAFETSEGANDGSTSDEWKALIATKSNWTISLV